MHKEHACAQGSLDSIPQVIAQAMNVGLEQNLPSQVCTQVSGVVSESFRAAFKGSIVPAFEQAMTVMFTQVRNPSLHLKDQKQDRNPTGWKDLKQASTARCPVIEQSLNFRV